MTFSPTDTGLEQDFIQDATVNETQKTYTHGDEEFIWASMTSNKERLDPCSHFIEPTRLHDNLTIVNAELKLTRQSYSGDPVVSIHGMEDSGLWVEEDIAWNRWRPTAFNGTTAGGPTERPPLRLLTETKPATVSPLTSITPFRTTLTVGTRTA